MDVAGPIRRNGPQVAEFYEPAAYLTLLPSRHEARISKRRDDQFVKAGVMLLDPQPAREVQHELDLDDPGDDNARLMAAMDTINDRYGRGTMTMASAGAVRKAWSMKRERMTPQYTKRWDDVPIALA